jgi:hypothetical protein
MKPIELTQEHKAKLLEMCKKLFPELINTTIELNGYINTADSEDTYSDLIHWFEFCVRILTPKILSYGIEQLGSECLDNNENPIDYLYKEFKKLKQ